MEGQMRQELHRPDGTAGTLYLCATPIGNLEDITLRVLNTLREADLIAAEDTRNTLKLLNHYDIHKPLTSYHEHNKYEKAEELIAQLRAGKNIALVTDAGTPAISDPGEVLAARCIEEGIRVTSLPGACALITGLTMSGMPARRFVFEGFLPVDKKERARVLESLKEEERTVILYEAPHRLRKTLRELSEALKPEDALPPSKTDACAEGPAGELPRREEVEGPGASGGALPPSKAEVSAEGPAGAPARERRIVLCRELTKLHEEALSMTLSEAVAYYEENEPRGEYVLILGGADPGAGKARRQAAWNDMSVEEHMARYESQGMDRKEAMKLVAKDRGVPKREIYRALLPKD